MSEVPKPDLRLLTARMEQDLENGDLQDILYLRQRVEELHPRNASVPTPVLELARRLDWALGHLVRRGQSGPDAYIRSRGSNLIQEVERGAAFISPTRFFQNSAERHDCFVLADQCSTRAEFELLLANAKQTGNISRASVVGLATQKPTTSKANRPEVLRRTRHIDPYRVVESTINTLEGMNTGLSALEPDDLRSIDPETAQIWAKSLSHSITGLNRLKRGLTQGGSSSE